MELQNGYKVIYNARKALTEEKPNLLYGSQGVPALDDQMLHYYANGEEITAEEVKAFKLIYSDGEFLYGSETGIPAEDDVKLCIKDEDGNAVFGEEGGEPVVKYELKFSAIDHVVFGGAGKYEEGANVNITVNAADGYKFGDCNPTFEIGGEVSELEKDGEGFKASIIMPAEALTIEVVGLVVEEKPVAEEGYWFTTATKGTEIVEEATAIKTVGKPEQSVVYPGSTESNFLNFAVRKDLGEIVAAYQPAMPNLDLLNDSFDMHEFSFHDDDYYLYVGKDEHMNEEDDRFDFCFAARN